MILKERMVDLEKIGGPGPCNLVILLHYWFDLTMHALNTKEFHKFSALQSPSKT